jgi:NADH:ubiquinone reductase (non-electrogenic)
MLTKEQFKELLQQIDSGLRALPATAQVAKQQGEYMAALLASGRLTCPEAAEVTLPDAKAFK